MYIVIYSFVQSSLPINQSINVFDIYFPRDYNAESERQKGVEEFYRLQHINQTYGYVGAQFSFKINVQEIKAFN